MEKSKTIFLVVKVLFAMYIVTGLILLLLTALLYKFDIGENVINLGVISVYIISGFLGGFILGKVKKTRKFLWGMVIGGLYFLILFAASVLFEKGLGNDAGHFVTTFVLCVASGMAGGMLG